MYVGMDEIFGHEYEITECVAIGVQKLRFYEFIAIKKTAKNLKINNAFQLLTIHLYFCSNFIMP